MNSGNCIKVQEDECNKKAKQEVKKHNQYEKKMLKMGYKKIKIKHPTAINCYIEKFVKTFVCDICGKERISEKYPVFDENWNKQKGLNQCEFCFKLGCNENNRRME